jgi:holo-[acyl-carrier protein] synthase
MNMIEIGMDIIEIERIKQALRRRPNLEQRIFAREEIDYCRQKSNPFPSFAARFAAKEAVLKAMGVGIGACALEDIVIGSKASGAPTVYLKNSAAKLASAQGIREFKITLTHSKEYAAATALALGGGLL